MYQKKKIGKDLKKNHHFPNIGNSVNFGIKMSELKSNAFCFFTVWYEEWVPVDRQLKEEEWMSEKQEQFFC